jgi:SAM-dependent methyltransferase
MNEGLQVKRETTNWIRFILEDLLPPIVRDSQIFHAVARIAWGSHVTRLADFRERSAFLTPEEYAALYRDHPRVHEGTDLSQACVDEILKSILGTSICDIGCGTGYLVRTIRTSKPNLSRVAGSDFIVDGIASMAGTEFHAAKVEELPFADGEFDTVVCTHLLEHLIEPRKAVAELRRVARRRLIIVVPCEREYRYTFNPHFNFFPYRGSLLRLMVPVPEQFRCFKIGRDFYYEETR